MKVYILTGSYLTGDYYEEKFYSLKEVQTAIRDILMGGEINADSIDIETQNN